MNSGETTICPTDDHRAPATAPPTWCPPFQVDISKAAKTGENMLEIEVTNLWINRLIGDEVFPYENIYPYIRNGHPLPAGSSRKTFEFRFAGGNAKHWKKTSTLRPSGLIGPVRITKTTPETAD
jgi:hypothetical protein